MDDTEAVKRAAVKPAAAKGCTIMGADLEDWVDRVFGRLDDICAPDRATLLRLTAVFENAEALLRPYADETLGQAFWNISGNGLHVLKDRTIEWELRHRLIRSFEILFREFFAVRCEPVLGHLSEQGNGLNSACYMWWDFDCWVAAADPLERNPMDAAFLASMRSILGISHAACQESALHGLGHWHWAHGPAVEKIIDEFLERERDVSRDLRDYARAARSGCVL